MNVSLEGTYSFSRRAISTERKPTLIQVDGTESEIRDEIRVGIQVVHFSVVGGGRRGAYLLMVLKSDGGVSSCKYPPLIQG
jgi:hypothetical protein